MFNQITYRLWKRDQKCCPTFCWRTSWSYWWDPSYWYRFDPPRQYDPRISWQGDWGISPCCDIGKQSLLTNSSRWVGSGCDQPPQVCMLAFWLDNRMTRIKRQRRTRRTNTIVCHGTRKPRTSSRPTLRSRHKRIGLRQGLMKWSTIRSSR